MKLLVDISCEDTTMLSHTSDCLLIFKPLLNPAAHLTGSLKSEVHMQACCVQIHSALLPKQNRHILTQNQHCIQMISPSLGNVTPQ